MATAFDVQQSEVQISKSLGAYGTRSGSADS